MQLPNVYIDQLKFGDRLERSVIGLEIFDHVGCYAGRDYLGRHMVFDHSAGRSCKLIPYEEFSQGYAVRLRHRESIDMRAAQARMEELLRKPIKWDAILFNCEQAVEWIVTGKRESRQINTVVAIVMVSAAVYVMAKG